MHHARLGGRFGLKPRGAPVLSWYNVVAMFRKLIIVVLTLGAVVAVAVGVGMMSISKIKGWTFQAGEGRNAYVLVSRGNAMTRSPLHLTLVYPTKRRAIDKLNEFRGAGFILRINAQYKSPYGWSSWYTLAIPPWAAPSAFILFAAYPTMAFIRGPLRRRRRRRKRGLCLKCGYDLRGSPGPRCPECGEVI